jgi:hypothetical protein
MKKMQFLGLTFVFMLSIFASGFALDSNKAYALSYPSDTDPYKTGCAYKQPLTYATKYIVKNGKTIGYVQLKGSAGCHTAWAYIKLYNPAPYNRYADAFVVRNDGAQRSCDNYGGNGEVNKGQTSCYTPQLWNLDPHYSYAHGFADIMGNMVSAKTSAH